VILFNVNDSLAVRAYIRTLWNANMNPKVTAHNISRTIPDVSIQTMLGIGSTCWTL